MRFFDTYTSDTLAGSGNQSFFFTQEDSLLRCRTYYKVFSGGDANYTFLFSNIIDSTFADGSFSRKNCIVDSWEIIEANCGTVDTCSVDTVTEPPCFFPLYFRGEKQKTVHPGEFFSTDPVSLSVNRGTYICLELVCRGNMFPCHPESLLPSFVMQDGKWQPSCFHPFPSMLGSDRRVKARIGFFGDSITQGIGTEKNSYAHWNALLADHVGDAYSYWNLGLGYGRADDAAADGAWFYKASQCDIVFVCFGVNDILCGFDAETIRKNLTAIVHRLKDLGKTVILQTVPPFDYTPERIRIWEEVNDYILQHLSGEADMVFDCVKILQKDPAHPHCAAFGGHPNEAGSKLWGEALAKVFGSYLNKTYM